MYFSGYTIPLSDFIYIFLRFPLSSLFFSHPFLNLSYQFSFNFTSVSSLSIKITYFPHFFSIPPLDGVNDICPKGRRTLWSPKISIYGISFAITPLNIRHLIYNFFPPSVEYLHKVCLQGFSDTVNYLAANYGLNCDQAQFPEDLAKGMLGQGLPRYSQTLTKPIQVWRSSSKVEFSDFIHFFYLSVLSVSICPLCSSWSCAIYLL